MLKCSSGDTENVCDSQGSSVRTLVGVDCGILDGSPRHSDCLVNEPDARATARLSQTGHPREDSARAVWAFWRRGLQCRVPLSGLRPAAALRRRSDWCVLRLGAETHAAAFELATEQEVSPSLADHLLIEGF